MAGQSEFPETKVLSYLGLSAAYEPSPSKEPIHFLRSNVRMLPPDLAGQFSCITTPKERTTIPAIRNRRTKFTQSNPRELSFDVARDQWPMLWGRGGRSGQEQGKEEKEWAEKEFMGGMKQEVGKLGGLLAGYEEEREAERMRLMRREHYTNIQVVEEEEEEEEEDSDDDVYVSGPPEEETEEEARRIFERRIRELFIYGMLETDLYDRVDWDDQYDAEDERESEERWFDEDDEE
ncbi:hypothetical protein OE88DRAFT_1631806 [Heliocybe sulcata]|uniref:CCD97-like C-terminal domain-containing protein n=1 Tax=Heliocybe sulcata TaxID=5364 RepID=A0A5C3MXY4_9AGAM|nr:hypothetical protein OE88DRAFT_1631806 [Heliocybe sulcata]